LNIGQLLKWVHWTGLGGTLLVLIGPVLIFLKLKNQTVWAEWVQAEEFLQPEYGGRIYPESVFRTRINAGSNIFYVCFGFHAIGLTIYYWKRSWTLGRG
jgi:hypothetical protein